MNESFIAARRFFDDKNFPRGFARSGKFTMKEAQLLEKHGVAYASLETGHMTPVNEQEELFLQVCRGERQAMSEHEKVWTKYKLQVGKNRSFHTMFGKKRIADDGEIEYETTSSDDDD